MKICVINGSPKGGNSITLQTVLYIGQKFPDCELNICNVGQKIKAYEKDMSEPVKALSEAELILFSYPVYTFLAPSQLHRFIELLKESGCELSGKFATQITTSKHFYDVTAHRYIEDNCHDLGLHVIHGLSADMDDLLTDSGRTDAVEFIKYVLFCMENNISEPPADKIRPANSEYKANPNHTSKKGGVDTVILADLKPDDDRLAAMINDFAACYPYPTRIVNIAEYNFSGGCLGCFNCAVNGKCIYRDGFDSFLRDNIQNADAIVTAFTVKDHSMGALFKLYDDRQFCNGHRTVTMGMPMAYIVAGGLDGEENLRTVIEARCEVGHNFYCGAATDPETVSSVAARLAYAVEHKYVQPRNFYGVGGMKIFRDLIYTMQGLMKADHQFYKKHKIYDFPQKQVGTILKIRLFGALVNNPAVKSKIGNKMTEGMLAPYKKAMKK